MTVKIFVLGFVQGVGFRRFIRKNAQKLGLTGWVRNTTDGRVEIMAQGSEEKIAQLKVVAEKGNIFSDVKSVVVDVLEDSENFTSFELKF
jgi:acylphosphatase